VHIRKFCYTFAQKIKKVFIKNKKRMKRYFSLLFVLAMCLVACNCKNSEEQNEETAKSSEQKETSAEASVEHQGPVFVDLGLPSGTKWKTVNEHGRLTFDEAISLYGENIPTKEQFQELITYCVWTPIEGGYTIKGPSGNSIMLPQNSYNLHPIKGRCIGEGYTTGYYWSSTLSDSGNAWFLYVDASGMLDAGGMLYCDTPSDEPSLRLVSSGAEE
jgi:hypothetical protein